MKNNNISLLCVSLKATYVAYVLKYLLIIIIKVFFLKESLVFCKNVKLSHFLHVKLQDCKLNSCEIQKL